jgi:preprotein translocase subunit SecG
MLTFVTALHIIICALLVIVVLIQPSREGGGIGGSFGGSSQTIFGSSGGANFFTKFTFIVEHQNLNHSLIIKFKRNLK